MLPQARWVLEARLRELARGVFTNGAAAGNRTRIVSMARRHSAVEPQPQTRRVGASMSRRGGVKRGLETKRARGRIAPRPHMTTKNKHRYGWSLRSHRSFTVVVSVFRGTPPPKPFDCKIGDVSRWHIASSSGFLRLVTRRMVCSFRSDVVFSSTAFSDSENKKPCLRRQAGFGDRSLVLVTCPPGRMPYRSSADCLDQSAA